MNNEEKANAIASSFAKVYDRDFGDLSNYDKLLMGQCLWEEVPERVLFEALTEWDDATKYIRDFFKPKFDFKNYRDQASLYLAQAYQDEYTAALTEHRAFKDEHG